MIETFSALFVAHVVADFLLQPKWMSTEKIRPLPLLLHGVIILAMSQLLTGSFASVGLILLTATHLIIDVVKARVGTSFASFVIDQIAHLFTIAIAAILMPDLWQSGFWVALPPSIALDPQWLIRFQTLIAGGVLAARAGSFAVALLLEELSLEKPENWPKHGGVVIGWLERTLIYVLMLQGATEAIGFLIAAKSITQRFGGPSTEEGKVKAFSEYVIIGTLASYAWGVVVAVAMQSLLAVLPS